MLLAEFYSRSTWFESRPKHHLSWLTFFLVFMRTSIRMPIEYFKIGHDRLHRNISRFWTSRLGDYRFWFVFQMFWVRFPAPNEATLTEVCCTYSKYFKIDHGRFLSEIVLFHHIIIFSQSTLSASSWYENVYKSFRTGHLARGLQIVQISVARCSCSAVLWVSLVSFPAVILCVALLFNKCLLLSLFISLSTQSGNFWIYARSWGKIYKATWCCINAQGFHSVDPGSNHDRLHDTEVLVGILVRICTWIHY